MKSEGGVGITDIHNLYSNQVKSLSQQDNSHLHKLHVKQTSLTHHLLHTILFHNKMRKSKWYTKE